MRLPELFRTTGFRLGLLYLLFFGITSLGMFAFIYLETSAQQLAQVDSGLLRRLDLYTHRDPAAMRTVIQEASRGDAARREPRGLFTADGDHILGSLDTLPSVPVYDQPFDYTVANADGSRRPMRAIVRKLDSGELLALARDMYDIKAFDHLLKGAMSSGAALIAIFGLFGAMAMGVASGRRIDAVTRAIRRIVDGDLSGRLPTHGAKDDIGRLSLVVNGMLDELERLMREVKGVSDDVAHDLRTPLTRLLAGLERAERRAGSTEDYAQAVRQAIEEAHCLLATFTALLRISEVESGARRRGFVQVDLNRIAQDAVELFEPLAEEQGVSLTVAGPPHAPIVMGDPQLLFDAVSNLVSNALKFTPPSGRVAVQVSRQGDAVQLAVRDTGPGIPEEERDAVFRRFYRSEKSRHTPGNGLGLSMVAAVAKLHDMQVKVSDAAPGCLVSLTARRAA